MVMAMAMAMAMAGGWGLREVEEVDELAQGGLAVLVDVGIAHQTCGTIRFGSDLTTSIHGKFAWSLDEPDHLSHFRLQGH